MPDTPEAGAPPQLEGGIAAPVVYVDMVSAFGVGTGIGRMTLEMEIYEPGGPSRTRRRVVAHLRGPLSAFDALRSAIDQMEAMLTPPAGERPN